ncbi:MAG: four helix bundle protein [Chthoniobacterales bacterium]
MGNDSSGNVVLEKSYDFALRVISLSTQLQRDEREFVLSRQLVRSGTSIGALVEEAQAAQTRPDFHTKMCQAEKEARETHYWLRLIRDSFESFRNAASALLDLAEELKRILSAITKTTKS